MHNKIRPTVADTFATTYSQNKTLTGLAASIPRSYRSAPLTCNQILVSTALVVTVTAVLNSRAKAANNQVMSCPQHGKLFMLYFRHELGVWAVLAVPQWCLDHNFEVQQVVAAL